MRLCSHAVPRRARRSRTNSLGRLWLARGRSDGARFCRESAALLRAATGGMLAFALAGVGQAARRQGSPKWRAEAVASGERRGHKGFAVELELARAWSAAASGDSRVRASSREASALASLADSTLCGARAARALSAGRPCRRRTALGRLPARSTGRSPQARPRTAASLVAATGPAYSRSRNASPRRTRCSGAEAADARPRTHRPRAGSRAPTRPSSAALADEVRRGEAPTCSPRGRPVDLTPREREIALLAAACPAAAQIADRLVTPCAPSTTICRRLPQARRHATPGPAPRSRGSMGPRRGDARLSRGGRSRPTSDSPPRPGSLMEAKGGSPSNGILNVDRARLAGRLGISSMGRGRRA